MEQRTDSAVPTSLTTRLAGAGLLSPEAVAVYEDLVLRGPQPLAGRPEVAELCALELAAVAGGRVSARTPRAVLSAQASRLIARSEELISLGDQLAPLWDGVTRAPHVEVLSGAAAAGAFDELISAAHAEVAACCIDPAPAGGDLAVPATQGAAMARGVAVRGVYDARVLRSSAGMAAVRACVRGGEQARVLPTVPVNFLIADNATVAVLPPYQRWTTRQVLVTRHPGLAAVFAAFFEMFWELSIAVSPAAWEDGPAGELDPANDGIGDQILVLLAAGLTDHAIARELGVSQRTLSRRIADLQARLGARTRYQLGYQAAQRLGTGSG